ncbi:MAG: hypothetical protein ABFD82_16660 [Syntrophaceae bacterium]
MENKDICSMCINAKVFVKCPGCGMPVCEKCSRFELIGSGCGCVWPVYYCSQCAQNPMINPNAVFRDTDI